MGRDSTTEFDRRVERPRLRKLLVRVIEGPDRGKTLEAEGKHPASVGASSDNDLVLDDDRVSRYHLELQRRGPAIEVTDLGSRNGTFVGAVQLQRAVVPPGTRLSLGATVIELAEGAALGPSARRGGGAIDDVPGLVGRSEALDEVAALIRTVAPKNVPVLIQGETGTGKEVVARAIHELSPRKGGPLVVVDCGAMPATLIASELFGHERGAFTGADQRKAGAFELAHGGTLFLDEIGELPLSVQPALLGVLDRRRFRRLGGSRVIEVDVRVLAATHRDLRGEANEDSFRADLYFRLAVTRIRLPALRERPEDIEPLVAHFVRESHGSEEPFPFSPGTMEALSRQRWSGNVRELRNVVEAALAMGRLQLDRTAAPGGEGAGDEQGVRPYREARAEAVATFETGYLRRLIARCEGNASLAARLAMMDRPYLLSLLKKHGLR